VNTLLLNGKINPFEFSSALALASQKDKEPAVKVFIRLKSQQG